MLAGKGISSGIQSNLDSGDLGLAQGSREEVSEDIVREVMGVLPWGTDQGMHSLKGYPK